MTNQNNAAQAAQDLAHEIWAAAQTPPDDTIDAAVARIVAVLSRLRAPVAHQDERAAFDHWFDTAQGNAGPWSAWQARAALASAPVTEDDEVERIRGLGPAYPYTPNTAPPTPLAIAPVAGEAQQPVAVVRDNPEDYGTVIDALVALPVGTQLFAAPQPSSVAGEAQLLAVAWRINAAEARAYGKVATAATLEECARELESLDAAPSARADAEITSYALVGGTRVERVAQPDGTYLWAVRRNGRCLGLDGHWSYEPLPSSRTTQWLALHRFPTAQAAIAAQEGHNKGQDHG